MTRKEAVHFLCTQPYKLGHLLGFTDLTELNNQWIVDMIRGKGDRTLQAHRLSYKTTCVSIALAIIMLLFPNARIMFMRKTDNDVKEVVAQVKKILQSSYMAVFATAIYGIQLQLISSNATEITTNLQTDIRGTAQLVAIGCGGSLTGKHFDRIFTDDIINIQDRISKAERERTKLIYQELKNIVTPNGRIYNTGTPWHKDDCFSIMPPAQRYDCYTTGLMSAELIAEKKASMTSSLFAANYELKHIADEDALFVDPNINADAAKVEQGNAHIDAAYGGEDGTAFTICRNVGEDYFVLGKLWQKHIDDCLDECLALVDRFMAGRIYVEDNGDKGYLAKEIRNRHYRVSKYHEDMNKFLKISSYMKPIWSHIYFVEGTDEAYINQICDFNENAEHDDAPDSLASLIRKVYFKRDEAESTYISPFSGG